MWLGVRWLSTLNRGHDAKVTGSTGSFFTLIQLPQAYHTQASSILGLRMREEWEFSLRDLRDILKDKPAS